MIKELLVSTLLLHSLSDQPFMTPSEFHSKVIQSAKEREEQEYLHLKDDVQVSLQQAVESESLPAVVIIGYTSALYYSETTMIRVKTELEAAGWKVKKVKKDFNQWVWEINE